MKKWFVFLLTMMMLLAMWTVPVSAAGDPVLEYEVTIDGLDVKEAEAGDIVTVTLHLQRTDADLPYTMLAMQSELRYDGAFFELIEVSPHLYDGGQSTDIARESTYREFYMNFVSLSGGVQWEPRTRVGSFELRVIGTEGVSTITNEDFLVSKPDGSGSYDCSSNELTVVVTTDCLVKFETNGGTEIEPVVAIYGELLARPEDPVREGKHLEGWYKDIHLTEEWDFETDTVKGNMTLYAKWADGNPAGDDSCIICGRDNTPIPGIPLCGFCLLILLLILLVLILIGCVIRNGQKNRDRKENVKNE